MSKRLGGIKGCKYKTSSMAFERVKISLLGLKEKSETLLVCGTFLNLRGVEFTRFALFYCFLVRENLVYRYICLVFIPSPALLQKNKQASDWVDAEENIKGVELTRFALFIAF